MFCAKCGNQLTEGAKFCGFCGTLVASFSAPAPASAPAAEPQPQAEPAEAEQPVEPAQPVEDAQPEAEQPVEPAQPAVEEPAEPEQPVDEQPTQVQPEQVQPTQVQPEQVQPTQVQPEPVQPTQQQPYVQQPYAQQQYAQQQYAQQQYASQSPYPQPPYPQQGYQQPYPNYPVPVAPQPKGCLAQAFDDLMANLSLIIKVALIPAGIALVSLLIMCIPAIGPFIGVCGIVVALVAYVCCNGYSIKWGREAAKPSGFDPQSLPLDTDSFSLGFFGEVVAGLLRVVGVLPVVIVSASSVVGLIGTASSAVSSMGYYGSSYSENILTSAALSSLGLIMLAAIASVVLSIFAEMFAQMAVMHMAVRNKVDKAFDVVGLWKGFANKSKLFCAAVLPGWIIGAISFVITSIATGIVTSSVNSVAHNMAYSSSYSTSDLTALGAGLFVYVAFIAFVSLLGAALTSLLRSRAVSYWIARYNPSWLND